MNLTLTKIELQHFKGIKNRVETFNSESTVISGANGTGKSTLMNAFVWAIWGKDVLDRKDHNIKPIGADGENLYEKPQCAVTLHFVRNGISLVIKRVYVEKWQKKRGSIGEEFTGHETEFYIDSVPKSKKEFDSFMSALFDETVFKILTNPLFFSKDSKDFGWTERRSILKSLITMPSDLEVCDSLGELSGIESLREYIMQGKTIDDIKAMLAMSKKEFEKKKTEIPARIDEINQSIKPVTLDKESIQAQIDTIGDTILSTKEKIKFLEAQKVETLTGQKIKDLKQDIGIIQAEKESFVSSEKAKERIKIQQHNSSIQVLKSSIASLEITLSQHKKSLANIDSSMSADKIAKDDCLKAYKEAKALVFEPAEFVPFSKPSIDDFACPTCGSKIAPEKYEEKAKSMEENYLIEFNTKEKKREEDFNTSKANSLASLLEKGTALKSTIEQYDKKRSVVLANIAEVEVQIEQSKKELYEKETNAIALEKINTDQFDSDIEQKNKEIEALESSQSSNTEEESRVLKVESFNNELEQLSSKKDEYVSLLSDLKFNESLEERKLQLNNDVRFVNSELLKLEALEYARQQFIKKGAELVDEKVNQMFDGVTFKLFETQVNGQQVECCKVLVDGVPFESANTAGQINSGLKIINTLCKHFKMNLPVWVDNAESVTDIFKTDSQQILLRVG
jgi:exonuclease SbcC